jgi:hypothetical protein
MAEGAVPGVAAIEPPHTFHTAERMRDPLSAFFQIKKCRTQRRRSELLR